jgi:predicted kinase
VTKLAAITIMGLPGAGKTSLAQALAEKIPARIVSRDVIRLALFQPCSFTHKEKLAAFEAMLPAIAVNCELGYFTIAEGMPFSRTGEFEAVNEALMDLGAHAAPLFLDVDPQTASNRIAEQRAANLPMADDRDVTLAHEVRRRFRPLPVGTHVLDATLSKTKILEEALAWIRSESGSDSKVITRHSGI